MSDEARSQAAIAIQIPAWFVGAPHAYSFREVAEGMFGRVISLESAGSSAYTALGCEMCHVLQDAYQCDGPSRLAVSEYDRYLATASIIKTPFLHIFDRLEMRYSTLISNNSAELSIWIDSFLGACPADMVALAGSNVDSMIFQKALSLSNFASRVETNGSVKAEDVLAKVSAQAAKEALEIHNSDCSEFSECFDIRREADEIAGEYEFRCPKVWPAVNNRHWRTGLDLSPNMGYVPVYNARQYAYVQPQWMNHGKAMLAVRT